MSPFGMVPLGSLPHALKGLVQAGDIPVEDLPKYTRIRLFNALIGFGEIDEITRIYV